MLTKKMLKSGKCKVTFELPADVNAETAALCGEFNDWDKESEPMKKLKNGTFKAVLTLEVGKEYRFRYWLDGERWENDWDADAYKPNGFGSEDSIIAL